MTKFQDGDTAYSIEFSIARNQLVGRVYGFNAETIDTLTYEGTKVYTTRLEALEAMKKMIDDMIDCEVKNATL